MLRSLVGSEMCIRDRQLTVRLNSASGQTGQGLLFSISACLPLLQLVDRLFFTLLSTGTSLCVLCFHLPRRSPFKMSQKHERKERLRASDFMKAGNSSGRQSSRNQSQRTNDQRQPTPGSSTTRDNSRKPRASDPSVSGSARQRRAQKFSANSCLLYTSPSPRDS